MCEVGSCCGCISLYKGCLIIGFIAMLVSLSQTLVFSFILSVSYDSFVVVPPLANNTKEKDAPPPSYTFPNSCPFGFIPVKPPVKNVTDNSTEEPELAPFYVNSSLESLEYSEIINSTVYVDCLAPPPGVLWAIVIASACYAPVGILLIIGIKKGISCLLSTWFFYTVGYDLLCLIVALTDGVYTSAGDISSYVSCLVTAYCIIVVDSYYEKLLLRLEKAAESDATQGNPSLVVEKSTPVSPTSPECSPVYNAPIGKFMSVPPGYAPPGESSDFHPAHRLPEIFHGRR